MSTTASSPECAPYLDSNLSLEARVEDLLGRLTLEEKVSLVHGDTKFTTNAIPRLGIPTRWLSDGPHGVREDVGPDTWYSAGRTDDFASCLPALIGLAATWNPECAKAYGHVIGEEALARGKHIMLGPGVNIMRTPLNGRNFEYFGEDPVLAAQMSVPYVKAVQSHKVASCIKHFAANNQETQRMRVNVEMDERALREIYLPAFKAAVQEAGVWTLMGAYNRFRGEHCCHNAYLLNDVLKGEWAFKGLVMSDWAGTHDTPQAVENGLDLEMGTEKPYEDYYLSGPYLEGLKSGAFSVETLDEKVRRNLRVMFWTGAFDGRPDGALNTPAHHISAKTIAAESLVLLKNESAALPISADTVGSIAVIGENAVRLHAPGGGSSGIKAFYEITPLQGITKRAGAQANVTFSMGYRQGGGQGLIGRAVDAAKHAEVAVIIAGLNHTPFLDDEATDRRDMKLPYQQDELIARVAEANPNTIVVLETGGPVEMPWLGAVKAVIAAWYPGMEAGSAIAEALFGDTNPGGKLPCTFPARLEDSPAHANGTYPGVDLETTYEEGIFVGYRWFDEKRIEPLFPFGHGLSYTSFEYSNCSVQSLAGGSVSIAFSVKNIGSRAGQEVAQVYVADLESALPRPPKELKAFRKVALKPGEAAKIELELGPDALAYYDPSRKGFVAEPGQFEIQIGSSSADIRLRAGFELGQEHLLMDGA